MQIRKCFQWELYVSSEIYISEGTLLIKISRNNIDEGEEKKGTRNPESLYLILMIHHDEDYLIIFYSDSSFLASTPPPSSEIPALCLSLGSSLTGEAACTSSIS